MVIRFPRWVLSQPRADARRQGGKKKCGPGQPPGPHLLRESYPPPSCVHPRSRPLPEAAVTSDSGTGTTLAQRPRTQGAFTTIALRRWQSRHARPFLRRPQRPGSPATLARFGNRSAAHPVDSALGGPLGRHPEPNSQENRRRTSLARSLAACHPRLQ